MRKILTASLFAILLTAGVYSTANAHCEIPCGIYHDELRFDLMEEHIQTIEKSMAQIEELSAAGDKNYNQLVRWITNKEDHADKLMEIVTQYFMTQRIKPVAADDAHHDDYLKKVEALHQMLVEAMKCKQTTDHAHVENLRTLLTSFEEMYMVAEHGHTH